MQTFASLFRMVFYRDRGRVDFIGGEEEEENNDIFFGYGDFGYIFRLW